jgi:cyclophilin family peptidyl-prolyl cis-trans isomerase
VTVNNFVFLARQGYYDNTTFHRVLPGFMAQGGDPTGTGGGGPGYASKMSSIPPSSSTGPACWRWPTGAQHERQSVLPHVCPTPHLDGLHTIFGEVIEGLKSWLALRRGTPQANPEFPGIA